VKSKQHFNNTTLGEMPHSRIKSVNIKEEEYYHEEKINLARNWDFSVISINKQILMNNAIIAIKIGILLITITILSTRIINNPNPSKCFLNYPIHQRITIKMKRKIIVNRKKKKNKNLNIKTHLSWKRSKRNFKSYNVYGEEQNNSDSDSLFDCYFKYNL